MLEMLDMVRKLPPETTLGAFVAGLDRMVAHAECRYCKEPISRLSVAEDQPWFHDDPSRMRGCHAASYRPGKGWNDSLPKKWSATPA